MHAVILIAINVKKFCLILSYTPTPTHTPHTDGLIGLGVLGGAALLGGAIAVGAVALAGLGISKAVKK